MKLRSKGNLDTTVEMLEASSEMWYHFSKGANESCLTNCLQGARHEETDGTEQLIWPQTFQCLTRFFFLNEGYFLKNGRTLSQNIFTLALV